MMKTNPFSLSFGKKPLEYIPRLHQSETIISNFESQPSPNQVYMITGVRGSGKTVMMATIASHFFEDSDWIVLELSPERNLLEDLASKLYSSRFQISFIEAKIDLSFLGLGLSIKGAPQTTNIDVAIEKMLKVLKKQKKRLLITIDEAVNNSFVREFASLFQIYMRQDYPVFLLMTGLYENIYNLQNEKTLTFLYRAPKVLLEPLNSGAMINSYQNIFKISFEEAKKMALLTKGYSFAFQVLGYLCWDQKVTVDLEKILPLYDQYLDEYVYSKIWSELSALDKDILRIMKENETLSVTEIRTIAGMAPEKFSVYRRRLINKGIIRGEGHGLIAFALPRFDSFIATQI